MVKIIGISDLHGDLIEIPEGDILVICGDIVPLKIQRSGQETRKWLKKEFMPWIEGLPVKHVVMTPGNHDFEFFWSPEKVRKIFGDKVYLLIDESISLIGIEFYGMPWNSNLPGWAYYMQGKMLEKQLENIPDNLDILVSHTPPTMWGDTDCSLEPKYGVPQHYGCSELEAALYKKQPKYVFCGHIHSGDHVPHLKSNVTVINCSIKDESYNVHYKPYVLEYESRS